MRQTVYASIGVGDGGDVRPSTPIGEEIAFESAVTLLLDDFAARRSESRGVSIGLLVCPFNSWWHPVLGRLDYSGQDERAKDGGAGGCSNAGGHGLRARIGVDCGEML